MIHVITIGFGAKIEASKIKYTFSTQPSSQTTFVKKGSGRMFAKEASRMS